MNSKYRWIVLSAWGFAAAVSQLLGLNFAPILTTVQSKYHVSEFQAGLLLLVFPVAYVLFSLPSGAYIDRHGYRKGAGLGVIVMTFFCWLRTFDESFFVLLIAQTGIAIAQPYIINGISKLVLDWFEKEHEALATGFGTMAMFIGMAIGMATSVPLVKTFDFHGANVFFAILTTASAIHFFVFVKKNPESQNLESEEVQTHFKEFFKNRTLIKLFILAFLGLGFFNGLMTWFELILAPHGINSEQAGIAGGVLILGGIIGAGVIPAFSDHFKKRKPFVLLCTLMATVMVYPLCNGTNYHYVLASSIVLGFFFLPAFSLLLEMCAETVGRTHAAAATGILLLLGNVGGVIATIAVHAVKGDSPNFDSGVHLIFGLSLGSFLISLFIPETRKV